MQFFTFYLTFDIIFVSFLSCRRHCRIYVSVELLFSFDNNDNHYSSKGTPHSDFGFWDFIWLFFFGQTKLKQLSIFILSTFFVRYIKGGLG